MIVQPRENVGLDQIVAIFIRRDLDNIASIFKGKYESKINYKFKFGMYYFKYIG